MRISQTKHGVSSDRRPSVGAHRQPAWATVSSTLGHPYGSPSHAAIDSESVGCNFPKMNTCVSIGVSTLECALTKNMGRGGGLRLLQFPYFLLPIRRYNARPTDQEVKPWAENYL